MGAFLGKALRGKPKVAPALIVFTKVDRSKAAPKPKTNDLADAIEQFVVAKDEVAAAAETAAVDHDDSVGERLLKTGSYKLAKRSWRPTVADPLQPGGDPRLASINKAAHELASGNFRRLRTEVTAHWSHINREFQEEWELDTGLHVCCREGMTLFVEFMCDPKNRTKSDIQKGKELKLNKENRKKRRPLHLCFTPPHYTWNAGRYGLNDDGTAKSGPPLGEVLDPNDKTDPGGETAHRELAKLLLDLGAEPDCLVS